MVADLRGAVGPDAHALWRSGRDTRAHRGAAASSQARKSKEQSSMTPSSARSSSAPSRWSLETSSLSQTRKWRRSTSATSRYDRPSGDTATYDELGWRGTCQGARCLASLPSPSDDVVKAAPLAPHRASQDFGLDPDTEPGVGQLREGWLLPPGEKGAPHFAEAQSGVPPCRTHARRFSRSMYFTTL
jgi:hypothetical protein